MRAKNKLDNIENSLGGDQVIIIADESLNDRGKYEVQGHEELGLLSLEEVEKRFGGEGVNIIRVCYEDDWRALSCSQ